MAFHTHFRVRRNVQVFVALVFELMVILLATSTPAANLADSKLYAVIAGVSEYKDTRIGQLKLSHKDALEFHAFLKDRQHLFAKAYLTLLTNKEATRDNLTSALRDGLKPAGKDDLVIVYLSGHGAVDPVRADEYYFLTYDTNAENLFGTALPMTAKGLFKGVDSDRILLISDACHSGGFNKTLTAKAADVFFSVFQTMEGRIGLASSRPDEKSFEPKDSRFGNSVFTHFLFKGLRGDACRDSANGVITAKDLYQYVYDKTREATGCRQNPQLYCVKGRENETPVFRVATYKEPLKLKVQFVWKSDDEKVNPLTDESVLKSGQRVGCAFRAESDCYVYILWWDSTGNVKRVFPNPQLTDGTGEAKGGHTYWLPTRGGKYWYVLDKTVGEETIYFVASRERNPKIEELYNKLISLSTSARAGVQRSDAREDLNRYLNVMGAESFTVADKDAAGTQQILEGLFERMENEVKVAGADAVFRLKFKHVAP